MVRMTSELVITTVKLFHVQPELRHSIKLVVVAKMKGERAFLMFDLSEGGLLGDLSLLHCPDFPPSLALVA